MANTITITFEGNSTATFGPNQTVSILVELNVKKIIKKAKSFRLTVNGVASTKWTEGGGRSSVTYQGEQVFINSVTHFFGKDGGDPIEVSVGLHSYKFSCRIPRNAPANAEGKFGYIRYKAEVLMEIPYASNMIAEKLFNVVRIEDLTQYPEMQLSNDVEEIKTFCCFCCESDPLMVKLTTMHSGFGPGDKINIRVEIFNRSSLNFLKSIISLNRIETFSSFTPIQKSKKFTKPLTAVTSKGVEPKKNFSFVEILHVPSNVAASNDRISEVFQITYEVKFYMKSSTKASYKIECAVPIFVGTVGFRSNSCMSRASAVSVDQTSEHLDDEFPPFCKPAATGRVPKMPKQYEFVL